MTTLADYEQKYSRARLRRDDAGVLEVRLETDGGPLLWDEAAHRELPELFADIALDAGNRVVILTGTGDDFCADGDPNGWPDMGTAAGWDKIYGEGQRLLQRLLDIPVPTIGAVNGPARIHSELGVMCDVVLASDTALFQDTHFAYGIVPGDGVHVVWPMLLGPNRGRSFLLMGTELAAAEALELGVVTEVCPADRLNDRAWEIARSFATKPTLALRYSRAVLTQHLKARMHQELGYGLMLEGAAMATLGLQA